MEQGSNHNQSGNPEPEPELEPGGAGQMMAFALIDQADRLGKSTERALQALAAQIGKLVELRGEIAAAVGNLEAERGRLQGAGPLLQQAAARAMRLALQEQSDAIEAKIGSALDRPLFQVEQAAGQIERAAGHIRQNVREVGWLLILFYCAGGLIVGLMLGYLPLRSDVNALREQGDRIERYLAAQQQKAAPAPAPAPIQPPQPRKKHGAH